MRLVSWNLGHQCREDPIPQGFQKAIAAIAPDVLSLNEYVDGDSRVELKRDLAGLGLPYMAVSDRLNGHNQVMIASRWPLNAGTLAGPATSGHGGASNFLHARIASKDLELVGVRAPAYTGAALQAYWSQFMQVIRSTRQRRIVFMGDFNTDPDQPRRATARHLQALKAEGWSIPAAEGDWSFIGKSGHTSRIDHVIASDRVAIKRTQYVASIDMVMLAAPGRRAAISDHTPLVVDVEC